MDDFIEYAIVQVEDAVRQKDSAEEKPAVAPHYTGPTHLKALAAAHHIPAVGVSETLQPQNANFQDWQLAPA